MVKCTTKKFCLPHPTRPPFLELFHVISVAILRGMIHRIPSSHVADALARLAAARKSAEDDENQGSGRFGALDWERCLARHAKETLARFPHIVLRPRVRVQYRYFGEQGGEVRVRPFVAPEGFSREQAQRVITWHPAPDSMTPRERAAPHADVELLYRHFTFPRTPTGYFDYWLVMQELWASSRWVLSSPIATKQEFEARTCAAGWEVVAACEAYEPAVVVEGNRACLAVLVYCPVERFEIALQRITVDERQAIQFDDPIVVARGPRGYVL